jgi:hypothetical protein
MCLHKPRQEPRHEKGSYVLSLASCGPARLLKPLHARVGHVRDVGVACRRGAAAVAGAGASAAARRRDRRALGGAGGLLPPAAPLVTLLSEQGRRRGLGGLIVVIGGAGRRVCRIRVGGRLRAQLQQQPQPGVDAPDGGGLRAPARDELRVLRARRAGRPSAACARARDVAGGRCGVGRPGLPLAANALT